MNALVKIKDAKKEVAAVIKIDQPRMERALASKSTTIPSGLTREQKRQFILSN